MACSEWKVPCLPVNPYKKFKFLHEIYKKGNSSQNKLRMYTSYLTNDTSILINPNLGVSRHASNLLSCLARRYPVEGRTDGCISVHDVYFFWRFVLMWKRIDTFIFVRGLLVMYDCWGVGVVIDGYQRYTSLGTNFHDVIWFDTHSENCLLSLIKLGCHLQYRL